MHSSSSAAIDLKTNDLLLVFDLKTNDLLLDRVTHVSPHFQCECVALTQGILYMTTCDQQCYRNSFVFNWICIKQRKVPKDMCGFFLKLIKDDKA